MRRPDCAPPAFSPRYPETLSSRDPICGLSSSFICRHRRAAGDSASGGAFITSERRGPPLAPRAEPPRTGRAAAPSAARGERGRDAFEDPFVVVFYEICNQIGAWQHFSSADSQFKYCICHICLLQCFFGTLEVIEAFSSACGAFPLPMGFELHQNNCVFFPSPFFRRSSLFPLAFMHFYNQDN